MVTEDGRQFVVERELGRGAMGVVYLVSDLADHRRYAVKVLNESLAGHGSVLARFEREARILTRLEAPNIVRFHASGRLEDGLSFLAMEYLRGPTLEAELALGAMPWTRAVGLARQLLRGLAQAHAAGVVHRDLKPSNLILQTTSSGDHLTIVDFGVAKSALLCDEPAMTVEGGILGTPHYLSPEQAGGQVTDARCDIYSVGVILFEMLTGRLPFVKEGLAVMIEHMKTPAPAISRLAPEVPRFICDAVDKALKKDPDDRWTSATEFLLALSPEPVSAALAAPSEHLIHGRRKWVSRPDRSMSFTPRGQIGLALAAAAAACYVLWPGAGFGPDETAAAAESHVAVPVEGNVLVVSGGGYAIRAHLPGETWTHTTYRIAIDVWDTEGKPLVRSSMSGTVLGVDGTVAEVAGLAHSVPGRFLFDVRFDRAGEYSFQLLLPDQNQSIRLPMQALWIQS